MMNAVPGGYEDEEDEDDVDFSFLTQQLVDSNANDDNDDDDDDEFIDKKYMITKKELIIAKDIFNENLLNYFWKPKNPEYVPYLRCKTDNTILWHHDLKMAIKTNNVKLIKKFIDNGVDQNTAIDERNKTLIDYAFFYGSLDSLDYILNAFHLSLDGFRVHVPIGSYISGCYNKENVEKCHDLMLKYNILQEGNNEPDVSANIEHESMKKLNVGEEVDDVVATSIMSWNNGTSIFLKHIGLNSLVPKFEHIPFLQFLLFQLDDLKKLDLKAPKTEMYIVKSLILFHVKSWDSPFTQDPVMKKFMSQENLLRLINGITFHLEVNGCSIQYIDNILKSCDNEVYLELKIEKNLNFEQIKKNKESLCEEYNKLKKKLLKELKRREKTSTAPDLIKFDKQSYQRTALRRFKNAFRYFILPSLIIYSLWKFKR